MSFKEWKKIVEEGDTVMMYLGKQALTAIQLDMKKVEQTKFGAFPHKDFIGKLYGTKVQSKRAKGWAYILHPTPELWTVTLPHRTQILYSTDISLITLELELKPGSVVVESGTGSGSLSHGIIRTIKPNGHLFTYDFHEQRIIKAREEFNSHGIGEYVTCTQADACKDGFTIENKADAVFLDLPAPWDVIVHGKRALKKSGGRLCSFSPCIEQVQRTCGALRKHRFCDIRTFECLLRTLNVRNVAFPEANVGATAVGSSSKHDVTTEPSMKKSKVDIPKEDKLQHDEPSLNNISSAVDTKVLPKPKKANVDVITSRANKEMPGHTGYLTFASLYPYNHGKCEEC